VRGQNPKTSARSADTPHLPDAERRAPPSPARGEGDLPGNRFALRLGFRQVKGLSEEAAAALVAQRGGEGYPSPEALWRRAGISAAALQRLAEADAFRSTGLDRREALWAVKALGEAPLPLFAAATAAAPPAAPERAALPPALPRMPLGEHVVEDYATVGLSLKRHPVAFLRDELARRKLVRAVDLRTLPVDRRLRIAGLVLVRQRPGTASGVIFVTLEDETGVANLIVWPGVYARFRRALLGATLLACTGRLQREGAVIHVVAERLDDWSPMLASLRAAPGHGDEAAHPPSEKPRHRSGGDAAELVIRSRDFH
jgi:error-prone DNA polymerase